MKKILVVDNDRILLKLMKKLLEKESHQVATAEDGLNALDILKTYTPDVIFVDLVMPNIDGRMLCRIIRSMPKFKDVYLVIISAISAEEGIDIVQLGANACIAKGPFNEIAQHVLAAVDQPDRVSLQCLSGEILGIESVYPRGITEELLSVKKHFEIILERMSEGILEINSEGRIVYANLVALLLFDMPEKDLLGSNFVEVFPGDSRYRVSDLMKTKGSELKTITEDAPLRLNEFQVVVNRLPLDEDASKSIIILHDVSERKRSEEALKSAREYAQNIIDSSLDMIITVDNNRRIVEFNRAAETTFGYQKKEVLGKSVDILYANAEQIEMLKEQRLKTEKYVGEITNRKKDGSMFSSLLSFGLMRNKAGEEIGAVGISRDITARKRAQEALRVSEKKYRSFAQIGLALSAEKDIGTLLEIIVDKARELSNADAGTLYILDDDKKHLRFEILQNDSMNTRMGGKSGNEISLPEVPLYIKDKPNYSNVSSYAALTDETVNIPDVYEAEGFDFTGTRKYDESTGYRSKSMLVIPMRNHENDIIGVLQLLNSLHPETNQVVAFSPEHADLISSLASQAAVALTNTQLIHDLKNLFYAFIKSIATAIDEKSPYTGGHINRVVELTMMVIEKINTAEKGYFKEVFFTEDEIEELRMAAWMHDVGKITTPEYVVDKSTKLQTIFDRIHLIETRFQLIAESIRNKYLCLKMDLLSNEQRNTLQTEHLDREIARELRTLEEEWEFVKSCNNPSEFVGNEKIDRINKIAKKVYTINDRKCPYLTEEEVKNLCIRKGSLTEEERKIIEHHATMTAKILNQLSFPRKLANVPKYASGHHEKLDGSGYPNGLSKKDLPLQTRIMAVVDIFEALTATDRPYRKPLKLSEAVKIMGEMKADEHLDPDIFDLFIDSRLYYDYATKVMDPKLLG